MQLLFSPFIYCASGGVLSLRNPVKHQQWAYKRLNDHRIQNLLRQKASTERYPFQVGQYVTITEDLPRGDNPGKLNIPAQSQLFKIREVHKEGFALSLINLSTCLSKRF